MSTHQMIISSIFVVLYFVLEAFILLKHLCLCLSLFQVLEEVLQAFELSACTGEAHSSRIIMQGSFMVATKPIHCERFTHK